MLYTGRACTACCTKQDLLSLATEKALYVGVKV